MKLETIKKEKKKKIIIGSMIVLSVVGCLTLTTSRAKYRNMQNIKLANGTIDYKSPDLKLAIKVSEDGANYKNQTTIPEGNYTINTEKSRCRIPTSTLVGEEAPVAEGVSIEYIDGKINVLGVTKKDTRCYIYFDKVLGQTSSTIIADIKARTDGSYKGSVKPTFSAIATGAEAEDNNGIFETDDPMYGDNAKTYYWRGAATTNHVIFDNKCWRIIRINGDESIRLIYNGTLSVNRCTTGANSNAVIMGSSDSEKYYATSDGKYDNPSYVGWTYTLDTQRATSGTTSNAKTQTELWYRNNISVAAKSQIDSNGKFCNDRNIGTPPSLFGWSSNQYVTTWIAWNNNKSQYFAYAGAKRIWEDYTPTLSCDAEDTYGLSVGAITADEAMLAGGNRWENTSYYLYTGQNYWTMTPTDWINNGANVFRIHSNGYISDPRVNDNKPGLRPVINLRNDVTFNLGADGTQNNPYIVQ